MFRKVLSGLEWPVSLSVCLHSVRESLGPSIKCQRNGNRGSNKFIVLDILAGPVSVPAFDPVDGSHLHETLPSLAFQNTVSFWFFLPFFVSLLRIPDFPPASLVSGCPRVRP